MDHHFMLFLMSLAFFLLAVGAAQAWAFAFRYAHENWRKWPEGEHLMRLTIVLALLLTMTLVFNAFAPPLWLAAVVSVILFGALDYELYRRHRLLTLAQRQRRDELERISDEV
jgi:hypothetical protein